MAKPMNHAEKLRYMTETPLPKLVLQLATPAVVSMLISSLYNMAIPILWGRLALPALREPWA